MANFLDDISVYNAKAAAAISLAVTQGNSPKANLMSSLKTTANDITLTEAVRLNALTALINVGDLLDIPLPPYFPVVSTFANSQTYVGVHNDLSGLNVGDYQHLTSAEKTSILNKASLSDISFANLIGAYTDNASLVAGFATKQNALSGTGYVKASGGTITYDNSTFLTAVTGIVAADTPGGGQLTGTYASPVLSNAAVIAKVLTGFNPSAPTGVISSTDSIISAIQKLNANVNSLAASGGTINEITFSLPSSVFSYTAGPFTSGAVPLSGTFVNQSQNRFFAGPSSGGSGQPTFRAIVPGDFPASGATAGTYGSSSSIPVVQVDAYGRVTNISSVASASGGQVNTITYSVPAGVFTSTVTGTTAVGITLGLLTQTANRVWAGPASGAAAGPTFRSLVALDIPNIAISQVTSLQSELDSKMNYLLNAGEIWIGNASNAPTNKSLTGDVTMTINGVVTIENEAVTFAKMQNITSGNLLGRWDASTPGVIQQISLSADFDLDSGTGILSLAVPVAPILNSKGGLITYRQSIGQQVQLTAVFDGNLLITDSAEDDGLKWVTAQGDIEVDGALDGTFNITAGAVTLAKMATLAANSFIGNNTGSSATPIALSVTQATAMLNQFTTSAKGLVPAASFTPAPGKTLADYFLNAAGGWSLGGSGGGGTTTYPLTIGTGLSGTSATFDGSAAVTVSLNTAHANTWTALQTFQSNIYLGEASGAAGSARFLGSTSGYVVLQAAASPANQIYTLPTAYPASNTGYYLTATTGGVMSWATITGGGTVTTVSVVSANGFAGTVANDTTTPAITLTTSVTGLLKGNGTAISAATAGVGGDYVAPGVITSSGLTMSTARLLGRTTASTGAIEEITIGSGLFLTGAGVLNNTATPTATGYYGAFQDLATQTAAAINTGYAMILNTVDLSNQVTVASNGTNLTRITVANTGVYNFQWSGQFQNTTVANEDVTVWFRLNGIDIPGSSGLVFIPAKHSGTNGHIVAGWNFLLSLIGGDYIEIIWSTTSTSVTLQAYPAGSPPPSTASVVVTVTQQAGIVAGTGLTALNGISAITNPVQTFATPGTSGTAPYWSSALAAHTLNIPFASASSVTAGLISKTEYDTFNGKLANVLTTTGDIIYSSGGTTAAALPIGSLNQVLSVSAGGIPTWRTLTAGTGDVVGPSSSLDGNFAVFNSTTGKIIMESAGASLSAAGAAVFNASLTLGVGGTTTGQLIFRNSGTNGFTTTIQASTGASANAIYTWPAAPGSLGQILRTDGSGNLSWVAAGAGDMVLATANQIVTGSKIYSDTTLLLRNPAQTFSTTLSAGTSTAARTITFPDLTGTVALLDNTQIFTGAKTFGTGAFSVTSAATFSASAASAATVTINPGANSSLANPQLSITSSGGSNIQWMSFGAGSGAAPTAIGASGATRSAGTKIAASTAPNATSLDYAIGIETNGLWLSAGNSTQASVFTKFYVQSSTNTAIASVGQFENSASCYGLNIPVNGSATIASLHFSNTAATHQYIRFAGQGFNDPVANALTAKSVGTRIVLSPVAVANLYDAAIGVSSSAVWFSSTQGFAFWSNNGVASTANNVLNISGTAVLNLPLTTGRLQINGTQVVGTRVTGYGTPTGGNRTLSFAAVTQAEQVLAQLVADLKTHGLIS